MSKAVAEVKKAFEGMNPREKKLFAATIISIFLYLSYVLVFQSTFQKILNTTKTILTLSTELDSLKSIQQEVKALTVKAAALNKELEEKEANSKALAKGMKARDQINSLLKTLEATAQGMKLRLNKMEVKTSIIRKSKSYAVETPTAKGETKNNSAPVPASKRKKDANKKSVKVTYIHNKIKISSYSTYKQILLYIKRVTELPYAISFEKINMASQSSKSFGSSRKMLTAKGGKNLLKKSSNNSKSAKAPKGFLETSIDMEIFFK